MVLWISSDRDDRMGAKIKTQIACVQTSPLPQEKSGEEMSVNRRR